MRKMDELYKKVDEIIISKHRVMGYVIELARKEFEGEFIQPLEKGLTIACLGQLGKRYAELEDLIKDCKLELYVDKASMFSYPDISVSTLEVEQRQDALRDTAIATDIKDDIMEHIKQGYEQMGFIYIEEEGEPSIYDGEPGEALRELEYESYLTEMDNLINRMDFRTDGFSSNMDLRNSALIIQDMAEKEGYYRAQNRLQEVQELIEDKDNPTFNSLDKKQMDSLRHQVIYRKYEEFYKLYASKHMGFLTVDTPETEVVKKYAEMGALHILLGVSPKDIELLKGFVVSNYVDTLDDDIEAFINGVTKSDKPQRKIDVIREGTLNFIQSTISKSKEKGKGLLSKAQESVKKIKAPSLKRKEKAKKYTTLKTETTKGKEFDRAKKPVSSQKSKSKPDDNDNNSRRNSKGGNSDITR